MTHSGFVMSDILLLGGEREKKKDVNPALNTITQVANKKCEMLSKWFKHICLIESNSRPTRSSRDGRLFLL